MAKTKITLHIENEHDFNQAFDHIKMMMVRGPLFIDVRDSQATKVPSAASEKYLNDRLLNALAFNGSLTTAQISNRLKLQKSKALDALQALEASGKVISKEGRVYRGSKPSIWSIA